MTLVAGAGTVTGGGGTDTLSGIESINGTDLADQITGDAQNNNLNGNGGNNVINGGDGNDGISGGAGNDVINGGIGDDFLTGGDGDDTLIGGAGFDTADYQFTNQSTGIIVTLVAGAGTVIGSGGTDTLSGIENINGTNQADQITGDALNNNLAGNGGNDVINGGAGDDYLTGGSGNDTLAGGAGNDTARYFDDGSDGAGPITQGINANLATGTIVDGWGNADTLNSIENIEGTSLADQITGDALNNGLRGNGGNDIINGGDGDDFLTGGDGDDTLIGGTGFDQADYFFTNQSTGIVANLVTGIVTGGGGTDTLLSIEYIRGTDLADTIVGDTADNAFWGNGGTDAMDGGAGFNVVAYGNATGSVTVNLASGTANGADGNDTFINMEGVLGSNFADFLTGDAGNNYLVGGGGNDVIDGGAGSDRASYSGAGGNVSVSLLTNTSSGADGVDTLISIENLRGSNFGDTLIGNDGANDFRGAMEDDHFEWRRRQ